MNTKKQNEAPYATKRIPHLKSKCWLLYAYCSKIKEYLWDKLLVVLRNEGLNKVAVGEVKSRQISVNF